MPQPIDDDATIRVTEPKPPGAMPRLPPALPHGVVRTRKPARPPRAMIWAVVASVLVVVLAGGGLLSYWRATPPPASTAAVPATAPAVSAEASRPPDAGVPQIPVSAPAEDVASASGGLQGSPQAAPNQAEFSIETASEQQILDHVRTPGESDPTVFRFAPNPRILVLDFASLLEQGRMLNRVAALVEKAGLPHDRVMTGFEIAAAIRANGDTVETFYYGHDYDAGAVIRFFALADRDNIRLVREEDRLGRLVRQAGWFEPNAQAALISVPQIGADPHVTRAARATILHHELSHGEYFTNPVYVTYVHQFWAQRLTGPERERIRQYLRSVGYDPSLEQVMENEAQAYLMFTDGAEFFAPEMVGMSQARLTELRNGYFRGMPAGWLRDSLGQALLQSAVERP